MNSLYSDDENSNSFCILQSTEAHHTKLATDYIQMK